MHRATSVSGISGCSFASKSRPISKERGYDLNLKYIDPSYTIRSVPSNAHDAAFCLLLGHNAAHAGIAGRTNMVVGDWGENSPTCRFPMAVSKRKQIDPEGGCGAPSWRQRGSLR